MIDGAYSRAHFSTALYLAGRYVISRAYGAQLEADDA